MEVGYGHAGLSSLKKLVEEEFYRLQKVYICQAATPVLPTHVLKKKKMTKARS